MKELIIAEKCTSKFLSNTKDKIGFSRKKLS